MDPTREDLELYMTRKKELEIKLKRLRKLKVEYVGDTVRVGDARRGPVTRIQGYNGEVVERRARSLRDRITELEEETESVEQWIRSLPEGDDRNVIEMRYVDHMRYADIAEELGDENTAGGIRKRLQRFWEKKE